MTPNEPIEPDRGKSIRDLVKRIESLESRWKELREKIEAEIKGLEEDEQKYKQGRDLIALEQTKTALHSHRWFLEQMKEGE